MYEALGRIEGGVKTIKDDLLPPVATAANKAKEGVIRLTEQQKVNKARLKSLEDKPEPLHEPCEMIIDAQTKITGQERELAGLSKWRWWLMGILGTAVVLVGGWAYSSAQELTVVRTEATSRAKRVEAHERQLKALEAQRQRDLEEVVRQIKTVPRAVKESIPERDLADEIDDQPLTDREKHLVREILRRAEKRNGHSR